jgi:hypothetical protein
MRRSRRDAKRLPHAAPRALADGDVTDRPVRVGRGRLEIADISPRSPQRLATPLAREREASAWPIHRAHSCTGGTPARGHGGMGPAPRPSSADDEDARASATGSTPSSTRVSASLRCAGVDQMASTQSRELTPPMTIQATTKPTSTTSAKLAIRRRLAAAARNATTTAKTVPQAATFKSSLGIDRTQSSVAGRSRTILSVSSAWADAQMAPMITAVVNSAPRGSRISGPCTVIGCESTQACAAPAAHGK